MTVDESSSILILAGCIAIAIGSIAGSLIGHKNLLTLVTEIQHRILNSASEAQKHTAERPSRRGRRRGKRSRNRRRRHS